MKNNLNYVQQAAYDLIQSDARFIYSILDIHKNAKKINTNFVLMCQPYVGIFTDGAEQWSKKVGLNAPQFSSEEKKYYISLRNAHKLFELNYLEFSSLVNKKLKEHDEYFFKIRSLLEKIIGYYNVGTDLLGEKFCGNTVLCDVYMPIFKFDDDDIGIRLERLSYIVGEITAYFEGNKFGPYTYNYGFKAHYKDFHFYKKCPLKVKTNLGFVLFSVLCSINYIIEFIDSCFLEEIPQKLKFAYLLYYYLCDFIQSLNMYNNTIFSIDSSYKNRQFRNCLAHYGLGQYLSEKEIVMDDLLKGLTYKAFNMDYFTTKKEIYKILRNLAVQIENYILL